MSSAARPRRAATRPVEREPSSDNDARGDEVEVPAEVQAALDEVKSLLCCLEVWLTSSVDEGPSVGRIRGVVL